MADLNIVLLWDQVAQQAVINTKVGPTLASRAYAMVHTAIFDAWAAYDPVATSTQLGNTLQRPAQENTDANKNQAISYAAYRTLVDLFPTQVALFNDLMTSLGFDPNNNSSDITTAAGIGNVSARALLAFRHNDGSNQLNGYADTTGYQPVNTPDTIVDPDRWQPLRVPLADPNGKVQTFLTPQWGQVIPFGLTSGSQFRPPGPAKYLLPDGTVNPEYVRQAQDVLDLSANLTDEQKVIAEYWEDGPGTSFPPGKWMGFGQFVSQRDANTLDEDVQLFFALGNAEMDAGIATWNTKAFYDSERPITAIRFLFAGQQVTAWGGPYQGTQLIDGSDWQPYQGLNVVTPPFAEYTSGHSAFSAAGAEILKRFTGSDAFGESVTIPAGTSRIEAGLTPATDVTLSWATFSEAADQAGMSRRYGGIHFEDGDLAGRELGRQVAGAVWEESQLYIQAGLAAPPSLTVTANNFLTIQGSGIPAQLKCTLTQSSAKAVNEVGVFAVDDAQGTVNGIAPGAAGYLEAALSRGQVIFSALSIPPDAYTNAGQTRQLSLPTNKPLMFYMVQNGTTDTVLADGQNAADIFFASSSANSDGFNHLRVSDQGNGVFNLAWEDKLGGGDQDFNDMVLNVQLTNPSSLKDWMGVREGERELIDLSLEAGLVSGNFIVNQEAAYDNSFGLYRVADLNGGIDLNGDNKIDIRPGDPDYARVAVEQRVDFGSGLPGGGFLAPFLITHGTPEEFLVQNPSNQQADAPLAYFSFLGANTDRVDHVRLLGDNTFGFEDEFGAGDRDFNDLVVKVAFT